jgi:hypothetical protein
VFTSSRYYTNWCTGTSLKDSLVNALWRFEDLHLYKHAVMSLSAADWASFNVNQSECWSQLGLELTTAA